MAKRLVFFRLDTVGACSDTSEKWIWSEQMMYMLVIECK